MIANEVLLKDLTRAIRAIAHAVPDLVQVMRDEVLALDLFSFDAALADEMDAIDSFSWDDAESLASILKIEFQVDADQLVSMRWNWSSWWWPIDHPRNSYRGSYRTKNKLDAAVQCLVNAVKTLYPEAWEATK